MHACMFVQLLVSKRGGARACKRECAREYMYKCVSIPAYFQQENSFYHTCLNTCVLSTRAHTHTITQVVEAQRARAHLVIREDSDTMQLPSGAAAKDASLDAPLVDSSNEIHHSSRDDIHEPIHDADNDIHEPTHEVYEVYDRDKETDEATDDGSIMHIH